MAWLYMVLSNCECVLVSSCIAPLSTCVCWSILFVHSHVHLRVSSYLWYLLQLYVPCHLSCACECLSFLGHVLFHVFFHMILCWFICVRFHAFSYRSTYAYSYLCVFFVSAGDCDHVRPLVWFSFCCIHMIVWMCLHHSLCFFLQVPFYFFQRRWHSNTM
jgi:hypothetical protein